MTLYINRDGCSLAVDSIEISVGTPSGFEYITITEDDALGMLRAAVAPRSSLPTSASGPGEMPSWIADAVQALETRAAELVSDRYTFALLLTALGSHIERRADADELLAIAVETLKRHQAARKAGS